MFICTCDRCKKVIPGSSRYAITLRTPRGLESYENFDLCAECFTEVETVVKTVKRKRRSKK